MSSGRERSVIGKIQNYFPPPLRTKNPQGGRCRCINAVNNTDILEKSAM
jgi:hypothetical protein